MDGWMDGLLVGGVTGIRTQRASYTSRGFTSSLTSLHGKQFTSSLRVAVQYYSI